MNHNQEVLVLWNLGSEKLQAIWIAFQADQWAGWLALVPIPTLTTSLANCYLSLVEKPLTPTYHAVTQVNKTEKKQHFVTLQFS